MNLTRNLISMDSYSLDIARLSDELAEVVVLVKDSDDAEYWAIKVQHLITEINRCCHSLWDVTDELLISARGHSTDSSDGKKAFKEMLDAGGERLDLK